MLLSALNELRQAINSRNEKEHLQPGDIEAANKLNNEVFDNALKNLEGKRGEATVTLSLGLPLNQYVSQTEDIDDWEMLGTVAGYLAEESMQADINWEGPGDSHSIFWNVKDKNLMIKYYDCYADWEDYDEEDESDQTTTVNYVFIDGKWEKDESPSHIPGLSEEDAAWMKSIDTWERLNEERGKAESIISEYVRNHFTEELWKKNIKHYKVVFGEEKMKEMQSREQTRIQLIFDEIRFDFEQAFISNIYEFFENV